MERFLDRFCLSCLPFHTLPLSLQIFVFSSQAGCCRSVLMPLFSFFSFLYSSVSLTVYPPSIHKQKLKKKSLESESIWTCCGMPFGALNASQHWATICTALCPQRYCSGAFASGSRLSIYAAIHLSIHPSSSKRKWLDSQTEKGAPKRPVSTG